MKSKLIDSDPRKERMLARFRQSREYLSGMKKKMCTGCYLELPIENFTTCTRKKQIQLVCWCRECIKHKSSESYIRQKQEGPIPRDKEGFALIVVNKSGSIHLRRARRYHKAKRFRNNPEDWPVFLRVSMKAADKERNRIFDLSDDDIAKMIIGQPCTYCGKKYNRMTLDRINNSLGHVYGNVNVSCGFCNCFRSDLPYAAWLALVPSLRKQIESGELDEYITQKAKNKAFMAEPLTVTAEDGYAKYLEKRSNKDWGFLQ